MSLSDTQATPARDYSKYYTPGAIVLAGIIVAGGLFFGLSSSKSAQVAQQPGEVLITTKDQMQPLVEADKTPAPKFDASSVTATDERFIGDKNAPLTMYYWFDYQCPFCKQFEQQVMPDLIAKYVNAGKLKIVFRDFVFLGNDSLTGAEYSRAIWALYPDKFYAWHQAMFDVQDAEGDQGFGNAATIDTLISLIPGIDDGKVKDYITQHKQNIDNAIAQAQKDAGAKGVQGTPAFVIGKKSLDGARPASDFEAAIDAQLK